MTSRPLTRWRLAFIRANESSVSPARLNHLAVSVDDLAGHDGGLHASGQLLLIPRRIDRFAKSTVGIVEPCLIGVEDANIRDGANRECAGREF